MDAAVILRRFGYRLEHGSRAGTWKIVDNASGAVRGDGLTIAEVAEFCAIRASGMVQGAGVRL